MESNANDAVNHGMGIIGTLFVIAFFLLVYLGLCICLKRICEKCGVTPGVLIWIPIVQIVPLLQAAGLPVWMIILFLVPCVGWIMSLVLWWKISEKRGKGVGGFILVILLPIIGIPYLAFSE